LLLKNFFGSVGPPFLISPCCSVMDLVKLFSPCFVVWFCYYLTFLYSPLLVSSWASWISHGVIRLDLYVVVSFC
jgi:hypothetical protein